MAQWKPGQSGNLKGRPTGSRNRGTREIREILDEAVDFPCLVEKLYERAMKGNERAAAILLEHRFGRARASDELTLRASAGDLPDLSDVAPEALNEELLKRLKLSSQGILTTKAR